MADDEPRPSVSTLKPDKDATFLQTMRERLDRSVENEADERKEGSEDILFIDGQQWPEDVKAQRGKGRLCLTINKMPMFLDQIDGDIRLHKPGIKVKAVDDKADPDTADVIEGLIRYIERNSGANNVYGYGILHAAAGGRGAWRVLTDYISDDGFEQDIKIKRIINAYSVYFDKSAEQDDKQDGQFMFLITDISKEAYKEEYNHEPVDFEIDGSEYANWQTGDNVRVAEYFYKEKVEDRKIHLLENGDVVEDSKLPKGAKSKRSRTIPIHKIKWAKVDGKRVLDRGDVAGSMFPIVLVWGKQLCVNGQLKVRGIARHAKDSVRLYNYFRSNDAEAAALQPKQPYLMPDICLGAYKEVWDKSLDQNYPYLPYKVDPTNPMMRPTREAPAMPSPANREQVMVADAEIRDTVGIQKAALGMEGGEKSGVAIRQRKMESDTGQYAFLDNGAQGVRTCGKIILGMIPEIFDTERQLRILGPDMKEKVVNINDGSGIDLTTGRYDVDIDVEASYSTQREEFQDKLLGMLPHIPPEQVAVITDILFEMQDFSRADDIAERIKRMIPPEIIGEEAGEEGTEETSSEEGSPAGPPMEELPPPDPLLMAELQKKRLEVQITQAKLDQEQIKLKGMQIENELKEKATKEDMKTLIQEMVTEERGVA